MDLDMFEDEYIDLDEFNINAINSLKKVIYEFGYIPDAFKNKDPSSILLNNDQSTYSFSSYSHYIESDHIQVNYIINPFSSLLQNYDHISFCEVHLTEYGFISFIRFYVEIKTDNCKYIQLTYDDEFNLKEIKKNYSLLNHPIVEIKTYIDNIDDEIYYLNFFLKDAKTKLIEHLPEYINQSAYNLHSIEFEQRLKLAEMILI